MYYIYDICLFFCNAQCNPMHFKYCTIEYFNFNSLKINFHLYINLFLYCLGFLCLKNVYAQLLPDGYISAFCNLF